MKIGIANDHRGVEVNKELTGYLTGLGYEVINYGPETEESTDYPIYAFKLGEAVVNKDVDFGIAICGTGIGISIACNKVKGVRCAKCNDEHDAMMTRLDNDANIVAVGSKLPMEDIKKIIVKFLTTDFSHEERHQRRIDLIDNYNG